MLWRYSWTGKFLYICSLRSGGDSNFLACDLLFCKEPIIQFVSVFSPTFLVEFKRTLADLGFQILRVIRHRCWWFFHSVLIIDDATLLSAQTYAWNNDESIPQNWCILPGTCLRALWLYASQEAIGGGGVVADNNRS